jgi:hypothetical protein
LPCVANGYLLFLPRVVLPCVANGNLLFLPRVLLPCVANGNLLFLPRVLLPCVANGNLLFLPRVLLPCVANGNLLFLLRFLLPCVANGNLLFLYKEGLLVSGSKYGHQGHQSSFFLHCCIHGLLSISVDRPTSISYGTCRKNFTGLRCVMIIQVWVPCSQYFPKNVWKIDLNGRDTLPRNRLNRFHAYCSSKWCEGGTQYETRRGSRLYMLTLRDYTHLAPLMCNAPLDKQTQPITQLINVTCICPHIKPPPRDQTGRHLATPGET